MSAWGKAWGAAWGSAWGAIRSAHRGGGSFWRRQQAQPETSQVMRIVTWWCGASGSGLSTKPGPVESRTISGGSRYT